MTETVYAIIDNHKTGKHTKYDFMYKTKDFKAFMAYIESKGLN